MRVPLTVSDFIERAELVYGDRIAVVDEPDQPAAGWGEMTWKEVARHARAQAAGLDALGVEPGRRVAIVSHNSARLLTSFFGVSGHGRVLVPINFRLNADEVGYIVEHSGASMLLVDPELDESLARVTAQHRYVIGKEADDALLRFDTEPEPTILDEDATGTINYTSGTTARPKGVQLTHRSLWVNATTFGWQTGVSDRDTILWTLPMFHCNGWGMTYAVTGMGGKHIVLRKVDGAEILRRVEKPRRDVVVRRARGRRRDSRPRPKRGTVRFPDAIACVWSLPARRRRRRRSNGWRPNLVGSSSKSTVSPKPRRSSQ